MEYIDITLAELINEDTWNTWMPDTSSMFYKYVWKHITSQRPFWFVLEYPSDIDELRLAQKESELSYNIKQWLNQNELLFNKTYELIFSPTVATSKRTTKFNDTPQSEGSYGTDKYTSTVTTDEVTGTVGSSEQLQHLNDIIEYVISDFRKRFVIYVD